MGKLESEVEGEFVEWLAGNYGCYFAIKLVKNRGFPDRIVVGPGRFILFMEFKRPGAPKKRRGEKLQRHFQKLIEGFGFPYAKVDTKAGAIRAFRNEIRT